MRSFIDVLKSGQGVFSSAAKRVTLYHYPVAYIGAEHDKKNLKGDLANVYSDVRKATAAAHLKVKLSTFSQAHRCALLYGHLPMCRKARQQ